MRPILLFAVLLISIRAAAANPVLQFSVIYASDFKAGEPLPPGQGYGSETIVIGNIGTAPFSVSVLLFTASLGSTTTPIDPLLGTTNRSSGLILAPGQAYGYVNGDFSPPLTLAYVQSIFPSITNLTIDSSALAYSFMNPLGSGVSFQNTQTLVNYTMSIGGATAAWTMNWEVGFPGLAPGLTAGALGHVESNSVTDPPASIVVQPVSECSTLFLLGTGLLGVSLRNFRGRQVLSSKVSIAATKH